MREFRAHHDALIAAGAAVAGCSLDPVEFNRRWAERLRLPYPLLSDVDRRAGDAFGLIRRLGIGGWKIEWFRRATVLVDRHGIVRAVWEQVRVRGHALEVLRAVRALEATGDLATDPAIPT